MGTPPPLTFATCLGHVRLLNRYLPGRTFAGSFACRALACGTACGAAAAAPTAAARRERCAGLEGEGGGVIYMTGESKEEVRQREIGGANQDGIEG